MLIATISSGADIVEFLDIFETENLCNLAPVNLYWSIVVIWNISLLQFIFVLTEKRNRVKDENGRDKVHWFWFTEAWGLCLTVLFQDFPYLILRIVLMGMGDVTRWIQKIVKRCIPKTTKFLIQFTSDE